MRGSRLGAGATGIPRRMGRAGQCACRRRPRPAAGPAVQAVDVLSIAALLAAMRCAPVSIRTVLVALLLAGNVWTLADGIRFVRAPRAASPFSLPGVQSAEGVGRVDPASVAWADRLVARARQGERIVVLHGQMCPSEDVTNPAGLLGRLYIALGYDAFRSRVLGVADAGGARAARYVTVPVIDVRTALDTVTPGTHRHRRRAGRWIASRAGAADSRGGGSRRARGRSGHDQEEEKGGEGSSTLPEAEAERERTGTRPRPADALEVAAAYGVSSHLPVRRVCQCELGPSTDRLRRVNGASSPRITAGSRP
jgi:hypothetical protein